MLNAAIKFAPDILTENISKKPTRDGFGEGLVLAGEKYPNVVALTGDLEESTRFHLFHKKFPDRFIEVGVAEQNMMGVAAGLALNGKIPYIGSYATFCPGRNWDQFRVSVCYNNINVKVAGAHSGLSVGPDGATHQALEDIAISRVLPNVTVIVPCDYHESKKAALAAAERPGPVYIRFARPATPVFTCPETPFIVGKAEIYWDSGNDATILGAGPILYECLLAAQELRNQKIGVKVVNLHTIKPIDKELLTKLGRETRAFVVAEEHQINGGVFGAVAELMANNYPVPMENVGMRDTFGESGEHDELLAKYGMKMKDIVEAALKVVLRK
ncbi:MAG: transketolase family protein [Parcubacteria group bacterium]|nr:transketolase family protein [Parcubacteria group bacterium]